MLKIVKLIRMLKSVIDLDKNTKYISKLVKIELKNRCKIKMY